MNYPGQAKAERIIGFPVSVRHERDGSYCVYTTIENEETVQVYQFDEEYSVAFIELVQKVYKRRSEMVMEAQGWRCSECGRIGPLEIDHIKPRSKGRDDRIVNLRAVCASFTGCGVHERKHTKGK